MTSPPGVDRAAAAAQLWDRILELAHSLEPGDWTRPTPCPDWDVRDLLGHLSGVQVGFDSGAFLPPPDGWEPPADLPPRDQWTAALAAARRDWTPEQVLGELAAAKEGHVARLRGVTDWSAATQGPVGETTEEGLFATRCWDLWVHLQDLRTALGQPLDTEDDTAAALVAYRFVLDLVPWMFAKRVGAGSGAAMRLSLVEPMGFDSVVVVRDRRARFDDDADPAGSALEGNAAALTLLCGGRRSPEEWAADGLLSWTGQWAERFVHDARMF